MTVRSLVRWACAAFIAGTAARRPCGHRRTTSKASDLAALKAAYRRPAAIPFPADDPFSDAKRALGETLFHDKGLSVDGSTACATCHVQAQGFSDGRERGKGVSGQRLGRHTPSLWNLAWTHLLFWDGRAQNLEQQVFGPLESPDEMAQPKDPLIARLAADPAISSRIRQGVSRQSQGQCRQSRQGDRDLRAHAGVAADPLRPLGRGRRERVDRAGGRRVQIVHRQGRVRELPHRLCVHRWQFLRHRAAGCGPRSWRGAASRRRRSRLQNTGAARARTLRALHARRLARDAGRCSCSLRARYHRAQDRGARPCSSAHA